MKPNVILVNVPFRMSGKERLYHDGNSDHGNAILQRRKEVRLRFKQSKEGQEFVAKGKDRGQQMENYQEEMSNLGEFLLEAAQSDQHRTRNLIRYGGWWLLETQILCKTGLTGLKT